MTRKANPLVLLAAGLCLASPAYAQQPDSRSPELVLINGKVLTMDGQVIPGGGAGRSGRQDTGNRKQRVDQIHHQPRGQLCLTWPARLSFPG